MCDCGSMTVISASPRRSFFCSRRAVYMPTYPPPTTTILWLRAMALWSHLYLGFTSLPGVSPATIQIRRSDGQVGGPRRGRQHVLQHGRGEPAGERVLLADVVAAEQRERSPHTGEVDPHAVAE